MSTRKFIRNMHRWLGISSGLVVFIMAITGCLYAFKDEIQQATQAFRFVTAQDRPFLRPSQLQTIAQKSLPDKLIHAVKYNGKEKSAEVIFYHNTPTYYFTVFLNPYDGTILRVKDMEAGFFHFILDGHFYLWLPPTIGQPIVATATLVFTITLLLGLFLWYPKNSAATKQRFWFRWKKTTQWKRKNYDLHNILGFYVSFFGFVLAFTGMVWGFPWFASIYYSAWGGEKSLIYQDPIVKKVPPDSTGLQKSPVDKVWFIMQTAYPDAKSIEVHPPENDTTAIAANANLENGTFWKTDYRYYDQYRFNEIPVAHVYGRLKDTKLADKIMRMNYDIHVGAIGGLAGKTLAFLVSLIIATLPVTGAYIWFGRRNKSQNHCKFEAHKSTANRMESSN